MELYNFLLSSIIVCYIIYRLNIDQKKVSALNYFISFIIIAITAFLLHIVFTDMLRMIKMTSIILIITFVIRVFHKLSIYYSVLTAFYVMILIGFSEAFVGLTYVLPLRLSSQEYKTSFIHISVGDALMFLCIYALLKFTANNFIKVRKRIHRKYKKFTMLLSANLTVVFAIQVFVYSIFNLYRDYIVIGNKKNITYYHIVIVVMVLIASIIGTVYFINYSILSKLKYDRIKMIYVMDTMTDTLNRESGLRAIENQLTICKKSNKELTICYIDINDLKVINDMKGHREGDRLIKAIVAAVKENIRESDLICRLGGDEFVIVFPNCNKEYGEDVMQRISDKVKRLKLFESEEFDVSISYGFSEYKGNCKLTVEGLLDQADHQMYLNKKAIKAMV